MNIISCSKCGIVIDLNKTPLPTEDDLYTDEGVIDDSKAVWYNRDYIPYLPCPVCNSKVHED